MEITPVGTGANLIPQAESQCPLIALTSTEKQSVQQGGCGNHRTWACKSGISSLATRHKQTTQLPRTLVCLHRCLWYRASCTPASTTHLNLLGPFTPTNDLSCSEFTYLGTEILRLEKSSK